MTQHLYINVLTNVLFLVAFNSSSNVFMVEAVGIAPTSSLPFSLLHRTYLFRVLPHLIRRHIPSWLQEHHRLDPQMV